MTRRRGWEFAELLQEKSLAEAGTSRPRRTLARFLEGRGRALVVQAVERDQLEQVLREWAVCLAYDLAADAFGRSDELLLRDQDFSWSEVRLLMLAFFNFPTLYQGLPRRAWAAAIRRRRETGQVERTLARFLAMNPEFDPDSPAPPPHGSCSICRHLPAHQSVETQHTSARLPEEVAGLRVLGGVCHSWGELRKCPECHTYYRFYHDRDLESGVGYGATEEFLSRLAATEVRERIEALLSAARGALASYQERVGRGEEGIHLRLLREASKEVNRLEQELRWFDKRF